MNSQITFSSEEKKEILSTPKFRMNKSVYSLEREENTLDTLKQNINNEANNNELQKDIINHKNLMLNSILNKINNKKELDDCYNNQFSFDGKSKNYIIPKNEKDNKNNEGKKLEDNNIIIIDNNLNDNNNNNQDENDNNNEIKFINDVDDFIIYSSGKKIDKNFNYNLPLESDKSSEHFNLISFQGYSEEIENKKIIKFKKIPNQKKISGEKKLYNNPEIINKKRGIGYLSKQKNKNKNKNEIKLTPQKKNKNTNKNNRNIINKPINSNSNNSNHKLAKSSFNSSRKKRYFNIQIPSLIERDKKEKCFTEPNNPFIEMKTLKDSQKNTFFTSNASNEKNNNKSSTPQKDINKIKTRPFIIEKMANNKNKKDLVINRIYFTKKNPKNRNSVNFSKKRTIIGRNKNILIYEKNFNSQDSRSFSINKKDKDKDKEKKSGLIHSRNYSQLNNGINKFTYDHSIISKKIKNCVILLSQKNLNLKNSPLQTRQNSFGNYSISASDSSAQRTVKKIKDGKICSPFCKSKALNKKLVLGNQNHASSVENRKINNKNEKYSWNQNHTFFSSKDANNDKKFIISCNYPSNKNKSNLKPPPEIKKIKIKVNTANNTLNNTITIKNSPNNQTCFMNYNNNKPKIILEEKKGNLTERYKESDIGPNNIYSKKFAFVNNNNNSNNNINSTINNETNVIRRIRNNINKKNINRSSVINKEKKFYINEFNNNSINNSNNNSILIRDKNKFHEYFNEILANIDIKETVNNPKKIKPKKIISKKNLNYSNNTLNPNSNTNTINIYSTEKNILSSHKIKTFKPKIKYKNKISNNTNKLNKLNIPNSKQYNTINNSINLGYNNKFRKNAKISKKSTFTRENSLKIPKFKETIEKYNILRNIQNNQITSEVSIFIGNENICDENTKTKLEIYDNKKGRSLISNNNKKFKAINVNKKTIINVNQFYPSYYINQNHNDKNFKNKNKNNMTSYL